MKAIFRIILFLMLFQVASLFIASTEFFPNALYSDAFAIGDNPESLATSDAIFSALILDPVTKGYLKIGGSSIVGFGVFIAALLVITIGIGFVTKSLSAVAIPIIGYMFFSMWANSKVAMDSLASNLHGSVNYIIVMIGLGMLIMFVITILDYLSGQHAGG